MFSVLPSKECRLVKVPSLAAHGDGSVQVELEITGRFNELFQLVDILQLCIAIEEEGRVV
jgi:hypothetical protein